MKKIVIIFAVALLLSSCFLPTMQKTIEVSEDIDLPKHIKFIAQSGTENNLYQSVIDLDNNELVVLMYSSYSLTSVIRTGIFMEPDDLISILPGTDAPFETSKPTTSATASSSGTGNLNTDGSIDFNKNPFDSF